MNSCLVCTYRGSDKCDKCIKNAEFNNFYSPQNEMLKVGDIVRTTAGKTGIVIRDSRIVKSQSWAVGECPKTEVFIIEEFKVHTYYSLSRLKKVGHEDFDFFTGIIKKYRGEDDE